MDFVIETAFTSKRLRFHSKVIKVRIPHLPHSPVGVLSDNKFAKSQDNPYALPIQNIINSTTTSQKITGITKCFTHIFGRIRNTARF